MGKNKEIIIGDLLDGDMKCSNCGGNPLIEERNIEGHKNSAGISHLLIKHFTKCCGIEVIIKEVL